jgi:hypothetical protein
MAHVLLNRPRSLNTLREDARREAREPVFKARRSTTHPFDDEWKCLRRKPQFEATVKPQKAMHETEPLMKELAAV